MSTPTTIDATTGAIVLQSPEGLAPQTVSLITEGFAGFYARADELRAKAASIVVTSPDDKEQIAAAREHRLALKNIRVNADKTRKTMKEDSLRLGRAIDGAYNMLEHAIKPLETYLQEQEDIAERLEAERIRNLRETRLARLREADPEYNPGNDVASYFDDQFEALLTDVKDLRTLRLQRQQKEEQDRIQREEAERQERERIRLENERLRQEAEQREVEIRAERAAAEKKAAAERAEAEKKLAAERAKAAAERQKAEEAARKEREAAEAKAKAEAAARAKAEAEARALREANERRDREAKEAAERAEKERIAAEKKASRAPDKAKIRGFADVVAALEVPKASTEDGKRVATEVAEKVKNFAAWIIKQSETL